MATKNKILTRAFYNSLVEFIAKKTECKPTNHCSFSQLLQLSQIHKENGMYCLHLSYLSLAWF